MKVKIILTKKWWQKPMYETLEPVDLGGFTVPVGFITDAASSPRLLWSIFPPIGRYLKATIVHDYSISQGYNRFYCDKVFKKCLQELGIKRWRINAMFIAVVIFEFIKQPGDYVFYNKKKIVDK